MEKTICDTDSFIRKNGRAVEYEGDHGAEQQTNDSKCQGGAEWSSSIWRPQVVIGFFGTISNKLDENTLGSAGTAVVKNIRLDR
mgnify:CR=1 FL=1